MSFEKEKVESKAFEYFQAGFNCAEAICKAIVEEFATEPYHDIPKVASGFVGGIGGTKEDVCGTLAGGVIALSFLFGRMEPGADIKKLTELAAEFRAEFSKNFSSTNCKVLLEQFGEQDKSDKCKKMTAQAAGILGEIIAKNASIQ